MDASTQTSTPTLAAPVNHLLTALAKAQGQMRFAIKDANNPFFKSKYADLASVWEACKDALSSNGLSVVQMPVDGTDGRVGLTTVLGHSSGQSMQSTLYMKPVKNDPQGIGSCLTYMRRYALSAMVGVVQHDDDGNHASGKEVFDPENNEHISRLAKAMGAENTSSKEFTAVAKRMAGKEMTKDNLARAIG